MRVDIKRVFPVTSLCAAMILSSTTALSASITGTKCSKVGNTRVVSNLKYTCIKSGKKLIWNKGVVVKKVSTPTSAPTAIPTATPTPTVTPTPSPTPTIVRAGWELTYLRIWDEYKAAQNQPAYPFVYKLSPNVNKAKAQESIDAYDKAMKLWQVYIADTKINPMFWTILSESEYDWWKKTVAEQEGNAAGYPWDPVTNLFGHCRLSPQAFCGYGAAKGSDTYQFRFFQYNVIGSQYSGAPNANTVNHEATHYYQFAMVQGFPNDTPCWYVEGQASLYGNSLEFNLDNQRSRAIERRNDFKNTVRQYQPGANSYKESDWITVLKNMYYPHVSCTGEQDYFKYSIGMFAWEYLYDTFGPKVMHQVLLDFKTGASFNSTITKQLNLTLDQLNEKLAAKLIDVFANGN